MNDKIAVYAERLLPLVKEITFKAVKRDDALYTSGLLDSMGTIDLALLIEEEFGLKIDTSDIIEQNFDSVDKIASYLEKRIGSC